MNVAPQRTKVTHGAEELGKRRKGYNDKEALDIVLSKTSAESRSKDTIHTSLERLWFECVTAYAGNATESLVDIFAAPDSAALLARTSGDDRYQVNLIAALVLRQVARLCASKGRYTTLPRSSDFRDVRAAKVGDHLLSYWHDRLNMDAVRRDAAFWSVICGTGFVYTDWDARAGTKKRRYIDPMDGTVFQEQDVPEKFRPMYEALGAYDDEPEGEIVGEALGPFQVLMPTRYPQLDQSPWIVIEHVRSMEWLWEHYPDKAKDIRPENFTDTKVSTWWRKLSGVVLGRGAVVPGASAYHDEAVVVREFWRPPSRMVEKGARIVVCDQMLLENAPHPAYEGKVEDRYPVKMLRYSNVPGRLHGMGMVEHLLSSQRDYNRARSQLDRQRDQLSVAQWMAPKGNGLRTLRNNYGDLWEYEQNKRPERLDPPQISTAHLASLDHNLNDMRWVSSQSEVTQGSTIPGVRSGTAIRQLQERDAETMGIAYEEHQAAMQATARRILSLTAANMSKPRAVVIYGAAQAVDIEYFVGEDLRGNNTVVVQPGSMQPKSKALAREDAMDLMSVGALDPQDPTHARRIFQALDVGDMDATFTDHDQNERRAGIENDLIARPQIDEVTGRPQPPPDVMDYDDHQVHIQTHIRWLQTDEGDAADPAIKQVMLAHLQKHYRLAAMQAMALAQAQGAGQPQGSPPKETGQPSPPKRSSSSAP